jgi:hypothetical protein
VQSNKEFYLSEVCPEGCELDREFYVVGDGFDKVGQEFTT